MMLINRKIAKIKNSLETNVTIDEMFMNIMISSRYVIPSFVGSNKKIKIVIGKCDFEERRRRKVSTNVFALKHQQQTKTHFSHSQLGFSNHPLSLLFCTLHPTYYHPICIP